MKNNTVSGNEFCPYCESNFDFDVEEDVWIVDCPECGRPTLLCDKCYTLNGEKNCSKCEFSKVLEDRMSEWKQSQIGRIVWFNDGDYYKKGWYKIIGFNIHNAYILEYDENGNKIVEYGLNIDFNKKTVDI